MSSPASAVAMKNSVAKTRKSLVGKEKFACAATTKKKTQKTTRTAASVQKQKPSEDIIVGLHQKNIPSTTSTQKMTAHRLGLVSDAAILQQLESALYYCHVPELKEICAKKLKLPSVKSSADKTTLVETICGALQGLIPGGEGDVHTGKAAGPSSTSAAPKSLSSLPIPPEAKKVPGASSASSAATKDITKKAAEPTSIQNFMVFGHYKNDLKHRKFFESQIGKHFHYTASGIRWLNEQWKIEKRTPKFKEYIEFWKKEHEQARKAKEAGTKGSKGRNVDVGKSSSSQVKKFSETTKTLQFNQFCVKHKNQFADRAAMLEAWEEKRMANKTKALEIINKYHKN
ncbi:unnamed protein product [Amoebophrya sp. A120]|nr:unnamed protein product [Amoebophrya sp. A120]|eukprot:GSA120T00021234001.1